jgi:hypothetical protein
MYKFSILSPKESKTMEKPTEDEPFFTTMAYSDSLIDILFSISGSEGCHGATTAWEYGGIDFQLFNKSDSTITVDWNKIFVIDPEGNSGNAVMHNGMKYNDCSTIKPTTIIPPHGKISDIILPCYGLRFFTGGQYGMTRWQKKMLPFPDLVPSVTFGVYIPLIFGINQKVYSFSFKGDIATKP